GARTTPRSCTRWTRSRLSCRKTPSCARRSIPLSRASTCDPRVPPRSPHDCPRFRVPRSRVAVGIFRLVFPSPRLTSYPRHGLFSLSSKKTLENLMEVVLDRDAFLKGLQMVQNIVKPRQPLPTLPPPFPRLRG